MSAHPDGRTRSGVRDLSVDFLTRKPFPGQFSIETSFARFAAALADLGVAVTIREAPCHSTGLANRIRIARFARRRTGADVAHVTGDIHFAALTAPHPVVLTIHDLERLGRLSGLRRRLFRLIWFDLPCRRVDRITVISEATRETLVAELPFVADKVAVIPTLVSDAFRFVPPRPLPEIASVLQIGTKANKNLPRLAKAMAGLPVRLVVLGRMDDTLRAVFAENGVEVTERTNLTQDEVVALYGEADIVTLVSLEEGFGMPIVEAQRVGRPVLTANVSSMPQVAGADGAMFVDPTDVGAIRAGLERLLSDATLREALVAHGRKNAERFDAHTVAKRLVAIYDDLTR